MNFVSGKIGDYLSLFRFYDIVDYTAKIINNQTDKQA